MQFLRLTMRIFNFCNLLPDGTDEIAVVTEKEIFDTYYHHWCYLMKKKYLSTGANPPTDEVLCFDHCLEDWMTVHWAWEVKASG